MMPQNEIETAAYRVVAWQRTHGRNHLPWQQTRDPYRVWLSEIMLQQTQVATVIDYYSRFLDRFPDVAALAQASQDEVMGLWSGLGYYSRARNLHLCAQQVVSDHGGKFPETAEMLATLPGIGKSTAGAIAAFCFSQRVPILDANVRRVLTRWLGFKQDLASARNERLLWGQAELLLPGEDLESSMPRYTQGLMDLGATICTPRNPRCVECPLRQDCVAHRDSTQAQYPVKTRKLSRRSESWALLVLCDDRRRVWLERRPSEGIWADMHCVPVFDTMDALNACVHELRAANPIQITALQPFVHVLTHRDLHLHPVTVSGDFLVSPPGEGAWFSRNQRGQIGLPTPIRKLLDAADSQM